MTTGSGINMDTPIESVPGLSAVTVKMLLRDDLKTAGDLITQFPSRHEDRQRMEFKGFTPSLEPVCHHVLIVKARTVRFGRRSGFFEADCEAANDNPLHQQLTLRWFNMPFMNRVIAVDMELIVYGKIKEIKGRLIMGHPEYEIVRGDDDDAEAVQIHTGRIVPVYRLCGGLKQKPLRAAVWHTLQNFDFTSVADLLPVPKSNGEFAGLTRGLALRHAHFPEGQESLTRARRYLALEEFHILQLRVLRRRLRWRAHESWPERTTQDTLMRGFIDSLPFKFTPAQSRCLEEIRRDMASAQPMNRLLHGDVGSGKTVVALAAMLQAVEAGHQAALMAPTQILAEQHYANALRWLEPLGIRVALRTGTKNFDAVEMPNLFSNLEGACAPLLPSQEPQVLIGTHALLYDAAAMPRLGIAVIDEQHKFGVAQRTRLIARGHAPHVLVMTATPIPRTLSLTLYGDLDVSTIDEKPSQRGGIVTSVRSQKKLIEITKFLLGQIEAGRQTYIVYPLIDESEKLKADAATLGFEEWAARLKPHAVGLLHGRMDADAKGDVMRRFRAGEIKTLVSTTVIEVGVDVPNATVMVIFNAERFGLAQLHQLRGRIGRGEHESHCILLIPDKDEEAKARLKILEDTSDGFRIAEEDLRRRGPGDLLGSAQSGQAPLRFAELLGDTRLLTTARRLAERILAADPDLSKPEHAELKKLVGEDDAPAATMQ